MKNSSYSHKTIALVGAPSGGKSACMAYLREHLSQNSAYTTFFSPEFYTEVRQGFSKQLEQLDSDNIVLRQYYILAAEKWIVDSVNQHSFDTLLITDRGMLDAWVYLTNDDLRKINDDPDALFSRLSENYDAVIYLEGASENFTDESNPFRLESDYDEIRKLSEKCYSVWSKLNNFHVISQQTSIDQKARLVALFINKFIGKQIFDV